MEFYRSGNSCKRSGDRKRETGNAGSEVLLWLIQINYEWSMVTIHLVYMVKDLIIFFLMHKADWNLSLKTDMSGCTVAQNLLSGER